MSERKTAVLALLEETRTTLFSALAELDEAAWETAVYSHDAEVQWTASDILRHLLNAETGMLGLMQKILRTGKGVPEDFDRSRYNKRQVEKSKDKAPAELMAEMRENRKKLLDFIDTLKDEDWDKSGLHAMMKILTIEEICQVIANHEIDHLNEIKGVA